MQKIKYYLWIVGILFLSAVLHAEKINVPIEQQVPIFAKIFQFDRHLAINNKSKIVICIIYQSKYREIGRAHV